MTTASAERNWEKAIETLSPSKCDRWSNEENPHWSENELAISWPAANESVMEECLAYINTYCDVSNAKKPRRWCEDPKIKDAVYPGKWRLYKAFYDRSKTGQQGIVRILRKGFATAIDWTEALAVENDDLQSVNNSTFGAENERYILAIFPNFDPESVEAAIASLKATQYVTSPTIQGAQRTGTWEYIHIRSEKQPDGSCWIKLFMGIPRHSLRSFEGHDTPTEKDVLYLWNVPKRLAQALVTSYETGTGTSVSCNYSTGEGLVDIIVRTKGAATLITISNIKTEDGCDKYEYQDYYWGLTLAQAQALDIGAAPQGWIYRLEGISYDGDGAYNARVTRIQARAKTVMTDRAIEDSAESTVARTKMQNQTALPSAISAAAGERKYLREVEYNPFCLFDYSLDTETVKSQTATAWEKLAEYVETRAYDRHGTVLAEPAAPAAGVVVEHENQPDGYGKYNTTVRTRTFAELSGSAWERLAEYDEVRTSGRHASAAADPGAQAAGTVAEVDNEPDGYGKYNTRSRTRTFKELSATAWEKLAEYVETRASGRHAAAVAEPAAPAAGTVTEVDNEPDGYGKYNTRTRSRVFAALAGTAWERLAEYDEIRTSTRHDATVADPGTQAAGTVKEVDNEPDGYGKYNSRVRTRTFKELTGSAWEKLAEYVETRASGRHASALTEPDAPAAGTVAEVDNEPDGYGKYNTRTRSRVFAELTGTGWERLAEYDEVRTSSRHGATVADPGAPAAGAVVDVENRPDGYGKYDSNVRTRTFKALAGTGWEKTKEYAEVRTSKKHDSAVAEPSWTDPTDVGTIKEVDNEPDGYGKYNSRSRTRTFAEITGTGWERLAEYDEVRTSSRHGATVADPGSPAAGTVVDVENRPDGYGKYDSNVRTRTFKELTGTAWEKAAGYTTTVTDTKHSTSAVAEPTQTQGYIREVQNRPDGYGKYDTRTSNRQVHELSSWRGTPEATDGIIYEYTNRMTVTGAHIVACATKPTNPAGYGRVNAVRRDDGLWYGEKVSYTYFDDESPPSWDSFRSPTSGYNETSLKQYSVRGGVRVKRTVTIEWAVLSTRSGSDAYDFIDGGWEGSKVDMYQNSRGPYGYRATLIYSITEGAWANDV